MTSLLQLILFFLLTISFTQAQPSFRPKGIVIEVHKDPKTLQYDTVFLMDQYEGFIIDLGGQSVWLDCKHQYKSSPYPQVPCRSAQCSIANTNSCNENTCQVPVQNGVSEFITSGNVSVGVLSQVRPTDGYNVGDYIKVPRFIFACIPPFLAKGLSSSGMAGLGKTKTALQLQLAAAFSIPRIFIFAICLPDLDYTVGAIIFGDKPYAQAMYNYRYDASRSFIYTKLLSNPVSTNGVAVRGKGSFEYFMGVTGITINGKTLPLNASLLSIEKNGVGGTKFSTVQPYSILETSIYKVFTESFVREAAAMNITRVASVAPFESCFSSHSIQSVGSRLQAPIINLVLESKNVWPVYPSNSLVKVMDDVMCLAFIDESTVVYVQSVPRASILLGGYQLENILIQFDLATSRIGFVHMLYELTGSCDSFPRYKG